MLDAFLAILTGGATGLLGTAVSFFTDWLGARQRHEQEVALRRLDMELARIEASGAERAAAIAAEAERESAAWSALEASHESAVRRWSRGQHAALIWVDVVRGLMRPALTLGALALVGGVYFALGSSDIELLDIRPRIVDTLLYVSTTCILWWFGARGLSRPRAGAAR